MAPFDKAHMTSS